MPGTIVLSEQLKRFMRTFGISHTELARAVGASDRTMMRWLADDMYPQRESRDKIDELEGLVRRLHETFTTPEGAAAWLHSRSGYFGGLCPVDALLQGRIDAVDAALEALDAGVFV